MQSCKGTYLLFILVILFSLSAFSQIPERPNAYDSSGSKHGEWVMFYDSGFVNILPDTVGARYFRLATFERGKPVGLVRDYYLSGILQWKGNMLLKPLSLALRISLKIHITGVLFNGRRVKKPPDWIVRGLE